MEKFAQISHFLLLLCLLLADAIFAQNKDAWVIRSEKDGIQIYHQNTPGLYHLKIGAAIQVSPSGVVALFSDVANYPNWGYKMSEARLLKRVSEGEIWYYALYDFPWPISDRDIILQSKITQNPQNKQIRISTTPYPEYLPVQKGVERIQNSTTQWVFTPGQNGWGYMEQQISTDAAEDLPDWLVKMTIDTGPRETMKAVRRSLQTEKYQTVRLPHIKD